MRINTAQFRTRSHGEPETVMVQGKLEMFHVRYAVLSCMNYTNQTNKLDEMLCYVLLCSYEVANKIKATERIFEVIDIMAEIIGRDYKDETAYLPARIFAKLESISKQILFTNITTPGLISEPADLIYARNQLENLLSSFDNNRFILTANPDIFLSNLNNHLQKRLNEIVVSLVNRV